MSRGVFRFCGLILAGLLTACIGDGSSSQGGAVVGPAGGTVEGPGGAKIVIPPGALATEATIHIEASSTGAPTLPEGYTTYGAIYALTPHGLQFAQPVALTLPFDPAAVPAGTTPALYKTNAANHWQVVDNATVTGNTISGQVTSFSHANVGAAPSLVLNTISRRWEFKQHRRGAVAAELAEPVHTQVGGIVNDDYDFGRMPVRPNGEGENALAEVYGNASGSTFWVSAKAPPPGSAFVGAVTKLSQHQWFEKKKANASLKIIISRVVLEAIDLDGAPEPSEQECPFRRPTVNLFESCSRIMWPSVHYELNVNVVNKPQIQPPLLRTGGNAEMSGWSNFWDHDARTTSSATIPLWNRASFVSESDGAGHARVRLRSPIVINVPLSSLEIGDTFVVNALAYAFASNRRIGEQQYVGAYFRDPAKIEAMSFSFEGIEPVAATSDFTPPTEPEPVPACLSGPDPTAGILQFESAAYLHPEMGEQGAMITVTRSHGSRGAVSVQLATGDDSGIAGVDYTPVTTHVLFTDGEEGSRAVTVPLLNNAVGTADKTVRLTLSEVGGCAQLGAQNTAVLTILDDDTLAPTYTVGGMVSGLVGSGLVLEEIHSGPQLTPSNGTFVFNRAYDNGAAYEVRVAVQPTNPTQICSVTNPSGTITRANVTHVAVTCVTPAGTAGLDPSFGEGGKVTSALVSSVSGNLTRAVALQSTGKIVVLANMALVRFHPDGRVDESFGSRGVVPVVFAGTLNNETSDLVIDANDRIIVVGWTRASNTTLNYDFAINRYDAHGNLDSSFDGDGKVTIDFFGELDRAHRVALDSTGRIVITGQTGIRRPEPNPLNEVDTVFILTRLNTNGSRDDALLARTAFEGGYSIPRALAFTPSGKIMLGGRTANNGTSIGNTALARFGAADGRLDSDEDSDSAVWFGALRKGVGADDIVHGDDDLVTDLVITSDDRIWGAVLNANPDMTNSHTGAAGKFNFLLAEFGHGFGDDGQPPDVPRFTEVPLGPGNDVVSALVRQTDGKLVLVGGATNTAVGNTDFGIVRFDTNGVLDTTFGSNGVLKVDFFGATDEAKDVVVQSDGKLVVVGTVRNGSRWNLGLARIAP